MAPHWLATALEGLTELADLLDALTERVAALEEAGSDETMPEPPDNESGHAHLEHSHPGVAVVHHHDPTTGVAVPGKKSKP